MPCCSFAMATETLKSFLNVAPGGSFYAGSDGRLREPVSGVSHLPGVRGGRSWRCQPPEAPELDRLAQEE